MQESFAKAISYTQNITEKALTEAYGSRRHYTIHLHAQRIDFLERYCYRKSRGTMSFKETLLNKITWARIKRIALYVIFGVFTTVVNILSYYVLTRIFNRSVEFSTIAAWFLAVLFAYLTNRRLVFNSGASSFMLIFAELLRFFASRVFTGFLDAAFMFVFVKKLAFPDMIVKTLDNGIVIVLNFVLSKIFVFTKKKSPRTPADLSTTTPSARN